MYTKANLYKIYIIIFLCCYNYQSAHSQNIKKLLLEYNKDEITFVKNKLVCKSVDLNYRSFYYDIDVNAFFNSKVVLRSDDINFKISKNSTNSNLYDLEILNDSLYVFMGTQKQKITLKLNDKHHLKVTCNSNATDKYELNVQVNVNQISKTAFQVHIAPIINYKVSIDSNLVFILQYDPVFNKFILYNFSDTMTYYLTEPFSLGSYSYYFDSLDLINNTINIVKYSDAKKLIGYKVGYYLNNELMLKLKQFGNKETEQYILYFWGPWCSPCLKNLSEVHKFANNVNTGNSKRRFISIRVILLKNNKEYNLQDFNSQIKFEHEIDEIIGKNLLIKESSFCNALNCYSFPSIVIVSNDGKIMHNGIKDTNIIEKFINEN